MLLFVGAACYALIPVFLMLAGILYLLTWVVEDADKSFKEMERLEAEMVEAIRNHYSAGDAGSKSY